jgi:tRNA threonylcarbamoyladenosine biosynthesis protein TsaB
MFINIGHANINACSRADACPRSYCQPIGARLVDRTSPSAELSLASASELPAFIQKSRKPPGMTDWILAIETVATAGSVALLRGMEVHEQRSLPPESRSAKTLAAAIRDVLSNHGRPAISLVAVARGPGSFTGLRVGITTAKALAYAWQAKLIGVGTLDAIGAQTSTVEDATHALQVVLEAQRKEFFVGMFCRQDGAWHRQEADSVQKINDWLLRLSPGMLVSGPAVSKVREQLPPEVVAAPETTWQPRAETIGQLACQLHQTGCPDELWTLIPQYLRPSYAEERRQNAK